MQETWFKNKKYGLGWTPSSPQGWIATLALIGFVLYFSLTFPVEEKPLEFFFWIGFSVFVFLLLCFRYGEKLEWRWGNK